MTKGHAVAPYGLVQTVLPASDWNIANGQSWFPRNLGEPCSLLSEFPAGETGLPTPGFGGALVRQGANATSETLRYRQTKETKCGGMAAGRHSVLIVLMKLANSPSWSQWREARRRFMEPFLRNTTNASKFDTRVHETGTDSSVGETVTTAISPTQGA